MNYNDDALAILAKFEFDATKDLIGEDNLDVDLHDNYLLPPGCKRYDEWADCDIEELLGWYE